MTAKLDPALCRTLTHDAREAWEIGHHLPQLRVLALVDQLEAALEEIAHATAHDGDWLSKASRMMCDTMLGDRDALRAKVRDLEKLVDELRCGDLGPYFDDELPPARAEAFRLHLAACATCQRDLESNMQIDARLSALAESREPTTRSER